MLKDLSEKGKGKQVSNQESNGGNVREKKVEIRDDY